MATSQPSPNTSTQSNNTHDEDVFPVVDPGISSLSMFNLREARMRDLDRPTIEPEPTEEERALAVIDEEAEKKKALAALEELTALTDQEKDDIEKARENILKIADEGGKTLSEMMKLAKYSESPTMFQALATLIRAVADTNMDVINVHEKKVGLVKRKKDIMSDVLKAGQQQQPASTDASSQPMNVQANNAVFVGTTADLGRMFKEQQEKVINPAE